MTVGDLRDLEIDAFLVSLAPPIAELAEELRATVKMAVPDLTERLRPGWRLIGYDLPVKGKSKGTYLAWVFPEVAHVHVGWQTGTLMSDPEQVLRGAHLKLKKVRYLTYQPGEQIDRKLVAAFTREAARIASMSRGERELLALSRSTTADAR